MNRANMFKYIVFICLNVFCSFSLADEVTFDLGLGTLNTTSTMKFMSLGVQEDLWTILKQRGSLGGWVDQSLGNASSGFMAAQLGVEIVNNGWVGSAFFGPGAISQSDQLLGGWFQFMSSIEFGFRDINGNYIGTMFRHFSSAGIETPNIGRNVLGLELKFPL